MNSNFAYLFLKDGLVQHYLTPPSTTVKCNAMEFYEERWLVLWQSNSSLRMGMKRSFCEVECNTESVQRWGKNKQQPLGVL
jgi:hypothetical protein